VTKQVRRIQHGFCYLRPRRSLTVASVPALQLGNTVLFSVKMRSSWQ